MSISEVLQRITAARNVDHLCSITFTFGGRKATLKFAITRSGLPLWTRLEEATAIELAPEA